MNAVNESRKSVIYFFDHSTYYVLFELTCPLENLKCLVTSEYWGLYPKIFDPRKYLCAKEKRTFHVSCVSYEERLDHNDHIFHRSPTFLQGLELGEKV